MAVVAQVEADSSAFAFQSHKKFGNESPGLLSGLLGELLTSAFLTATTASIANAIISRRWTRNTNQFDCHLPQMPSLFPEARLRLCSTHLALACQLGEYYDHLNYLRDLSARVASKSQIEAEIAPIAQAWQALAMSAVTCINQLLQQLQDDARQVDEERALFVTDLLMRVTAGETPCVDAYGMAKIPAWADRRNETRTRRGLQAFLQLEDSLQRVAVLDASVDGIGVLGLQNAHVGARVGLLVKPGYTLDGTVVWVDGMRAGIKLNAPLPVDFQPQTYHS
ncbi:MAG: PilZ domain-containing protein [Hyphomicrobium aestuarii]|nr:PilZ domain-containing protein [Hyphomicrobium aestuarii]